MDKNENSRTFNVDVRIFDYKMINNKTFNQKS